MDAFNLSRLDRETVEAVLACCQRMPSAQNCIMLHDFRGAAACVASEETAFSHRRNHFNMQVVASWQTPAEKIEGEEWMAEIQRIIEPVSDGSAYPAVVGATGQQRARAFYAGSLNKLQEMKKRFDPENRFNAPYGLF